jgi:regulator of cell morphogenesis and NO signaling
MTELAKDTPVGQWAVHRPQAIRILERCGVDYCCGGEKPLADACRDAGVDLQRVFDELNCAKPAQCAESPRDWRDASLTELCDHIERTHHAFLKETLPQITEWIAKVVVAHAEQHPELLDVQSTFHDLRAELEPHMMKEECILFPAIRAMERGSGPFAFPFGSVSNPIGTMRHEHDNAGNAVRRLHRLTSGYTVPDSACTTYRVMLEGLDRLETDLHEHIHKENNILFPRAANLEQSAHVTS